MIFSKILSVSLRRQTFDQNWPFLFKKEHLVGNYTYRFSMAFLLFWSVIDVSVFS